MDDWVANTDKFQYFYFQVEEAVVIFRHFCLAESDGIFFFLFFWRNNLFGTSFTRLAKKADMAVSPVQSQTLLLADK